jgi:hypothetical protein
VVIQAIVRKDSNSQAVQHILDTANVNCGQIAGIDAGGQDAEVASSGADVPPG